MYLVRVYRCINVLALALAVLVLAPGCGAAMRAMGYPPEAMRQTPPPGVPGSALGIGQPLPVASLSDDLKAPVDVAAAWAKGALVLVFYRGHWCPYCRTQLEDFQKHLGEFSARGIQVAAISGESAEDGAALRARLGLTLAIWTDPGLAWTRALGIFDPGNDVPWPAVYVIDRTGKVTWRWVAETYRTRPPAAEVLGHAADLADLKP